MADFFGTDGADRLRGTSADDFFFHSSGDDTIVGGNGFDTLVVDGSVHEYEFMLYNRGWYMDQRGHRLQPDYMGRDLLDGVEAVQFDEGTRILGEEFVTRIEGPSQVSGYVDEVVTYRIDVTDLDDRVRLLSSEYDKRISYGYVGNNLVSGYQSTTGYLQFDFEAVQSGPYADLSYLAQDEALNITHTLTFEASSYPDFDGEVYTHTMIVTLLGLNDAPVLAPAPINSLAAREDGASRLFDLSRLGSDIDSDDDGRTLSYEITSVTEGFVVSIDGTFLVLDPAGVDPLDTSDELTFGAVSLRAVDRHGAASNDIDIALTYLGATDPVLRVVTGHGVDLGALGLSSDDAVELGFVQGIYDDPSYVNFLTFTDGDDTHFYSARRVAWFRQGDSLEAADGTVLLEDMAFDTGDGSDALIFHLHSRGYAGFEIVDVRMGRGEDVVAIDAKASVFGGRSDAIINGADIGTGRHSDQIWLCARSDQNAWIAANIDAGSGNDMVEMRIRDIDPANLNGLSFLDASIDLGSGHDFLRYINTTARVALSAEMDVSIYAGDGNDRVILDNSASQLTVPSDLPTSGVYADLYKAGLSGRIDMGLGDDLLRLALNAPFEGGEGASAVLRGGAGQDRLELVNIDPALVSTSALENGVRIEARNQQLDVFGFEQIILSDGSDLLVG